MARSLELKELISVLGQEHERTRQSLKELEAATSTRSYAKVAQLTHALWDDLRQHIIDEEARVLKVLIDAYGREGAKDAIATFREHRAVRQMTLDIENMATTTPAMIPPMQHKLQALLLAHFNAEEQRIFPWAVKTSDERSPAR